MKSLPYGIHEGNLFVTFGADTDGQTDICTHMTFNKSLKGVSVLAKTVFCIFMSDLSGKEDHRTILLDWSKIPVHFLNASNKRYSLIQIAE